MRDYRRGAVAAIWGGRSERTTARPVNAPRQQGFARAASIAGGRLLDFVLKSTLLLAVAVLAVQAAPARAQPTVSRVGAGAFPISSIVVVKSVGGADIAYASGIPGTASAGDTKAQTLGVLTKLDAALTSQGFGLGDVVMMRVFLVGDPAMAGKMDFAGMMAAYSQFFGTADQPHKPARTTVQVAGLASPGALVEIEAQAVRPHS
jgi:enamine deaminase RidA (YjgF/YER057c/UK114 family)